MLISKTLPSVKKGTQAALHLNGERVGLVLVRGSSDSWTWGDFQAEPAFAELAPLFGIWSLVMHADEDERRLTRAAADELRQAEMAIDSLRATLLWLDSQTWSKVSQLNIDGNLIEWKHD